VTATASPSPFAIRLYRWIWLAVLASNVGTWMQTVGAQWFLVNLPNAAAIVALVQTADTLPDLLLAVPGGVLADIFDRRRFLIAVQLLQIAVGTGLALLTLSGQMTAPLLLGFTFALGAGGALATPAYEAMIPEIVPRAQLRSAAALASININLARAIGPAIAGILIARIGVGAVFALNTITFVFLPIVLLLWRRPVVADSSLPPETFGAALRAGGNYVRHSPVTRRILFRLGLFVFPATVIWALLPLVATRRLGMDAGGYGLLLGALGAGAIAGALLLSRLTMVLSDNQVLAGASVVFGLATVAVVLAPTPLIAVLVLVPAGVAWMAGITGRIAELQLFLPAWVRARGLSTAQMVLFGSQAGGAFVWGLVAEHWGLAPAFAVAAGMLMLGAATIVVWPLIDIRRFSSEPSVHWVDPQLSREADLEAGPVLVAVTYTVRAQNEDAFVAAMERVRLSRMRTGAISWRLYKEGETADRLIETYVVATWGEHLRQHHGRQTEADAAVERNAWAFAEGKPTVKHLFPAERD